MNHTLTTTDKDGKTYEVPLSEIIWRPAAYAIIIQERIETGLVREVKEETGLDVTIDTCVATRDSFFTFRKKGIHTHSIAFYYTVNIINGSLSTTGFDGEEKEYMKLAEWIPVERFSELKIYSSIDIRPIVADVLREIKS